MRSKDGTAISAECAGSGPSLVIVHGGTGDHTRWTPSFPHFAARFNVCAMDRRGFGRSGDSPEHSLLKEAEDVEAVVNSRPGGAFVLGHSYGGVVALEAALMTEKIRKLVVYEAPLREHVEPASSRGLGRASPPAIVPPPSASSCARGEGRCGRDRGDEERPSWARLAATITSRPGRCAP